MKWMRIGEKRCNCSCFEIDQEMDAIFILLIIGIVDEVKVNIKYATDLTSDR
jgi:hypothetical protein